jgi:hypothetical protein
MGDSLKKRGRSDDWAERVQSLSASLAEKRTEAINGRKSSGIETQWDEDTAHIAGHDSTESLSTMMKPSSPDGSFTAPLSDSVGETRSTAFLNITQPYCAAASARISDMLLPNDDRNWALRETPVADLAWPENATQAPPTATPSPPLQADQPVAQATTSAPQPQGAQELTADEGRVQDEASGLAKRATKVIDDWLTEGKWHPAVRRVIESAASMGTGILKGPSPIYKKSKSAQSNGGAWKLKIEQKLIPSSGCVSLWNFYPDPACGENIQNGEYVFERSRISPRQLSELRNQGDKYLDEMIQICLDEGPMDAISGNKKTGKQQFDMWEYYGFLCREELELIGCKCDSLDEDVEDVPVIIVMVNSRVIKVALSPLDSGEFPYDVMVWQEIPDFWAGIGIAHQIRTCQKGVNAGLRNMMDNAGLSAGPQIIIDQAQVEPLDGVWSVSPRKIWVTRPNTQGVKVGEAFQIVSIETRQAELLNIITFWLTQASEVTGLPELLRGQQGDTQETLGRANLRQNNGTSVMRRIVHTFDDRITSPHIGRYHEWLLMHGPDDAKGDLQTEARGSSALQERDMQSQVMQQMLGASLNPAYQVDPAKLMAEFLKSMRFDPKRLTIDPQKLAAMAPPAPPPDPRLQLAQISSQDKEKAMMAKSNEHKLQLAFDADQAERDRQQELLMSQFDNEAGQVGMGVDRQNIADELKTKIAIETMKLQLQKELSEKAALENARTPNVITPPNEPAGQANAGEAYQA